VRSGELGPGPASAGAAERWPGTETADDSFVAEAVARPPKPKHSSGAPAARWRRYCVKRRIRLCQQTWRHRVPGERVPDISPDDRRQPRPGTLAALRPRSEEHRSCHRVFRPRSCPPANRR
jgi:hypothetical protein